MKNDKKKTFPSSPSVMPLEDLPDTVPEIINRYGTYEIQSTADTDNRYPAIAQGFNGKIIETDCENEERKGK